MAEEVRIKVLEELCADQSVRRELLHYNQNHFHPDGVTLASADPDSARLAVWQEYLEASFTEGAFNALKKPIVQFCFPIREGIAEDSDYRAVCRAGKSPASMDSATGLLLEDSENFLFELFESAAGVIPILTPATRNDFVSVLQAIFSKNEPERVPDSQGATMVAGYSNWDRIRRYRSAWEAANPTADWAAEFSRFAKEEKSSFQEKFIVLSTGPYSGVSAGTVGLQDTEWHAISTKIRLYHECAHFFTRTVFGSMKNRAHDEIIADCAGICAVKGSYSAEWFLQFLGLEQYPEFRTGGRLANYKGEPELSEEAFVVLQELVLRAARNIESFLAPLEHDWETARAQALLITTLSIPSVEAMAAENGVEHLEQAYAQAQELTLKSVTG